MGIGLSTYAVLYGLFGGVGTLLGAVIGVGAIETIAFVLSDINALKPYWPVILGVIMLVVVAYRPSGLLGAIVSERERIGSFGIGGGDAAKADGAKTEEAEKEDHRGSA